ncbi:hypothetical protein O6H91_12G044400 [Diphasiastrum complanatum]|uniref:Uncharacterized protein n=1 Tax=Diphasiastrum complanatum TaxID=34168 RepID=A0ACC2C1L4_DIPCM|nr:hypothetical protein O6H91_12G044400 [Diphasiastrum complanatum]
MRVGCVLYRSSLFSQAILDSKSFCSREAALVMEHRSSLIPKFGSWESDDQHQTVFSAIFDNARANKVANPVGFNGFIYSEHAFDRDHTVQKSNEGNIAADLLQTQILQSAVSETNTHHNIIRGNPYAAFKKRSSIEQRENIAQETRPLADDGNFISPRAEQRLEAGLACRASSGGLIAPVQSEFGKWNAKVSSKELQSIALFNNTIRKANYRPQKAKVPVFYDCQSEEDLLPHRPRAISRKFRIKFRSCFSCQTY